MPASQIGDRGADFENSERYERWRAVAESRTPTQGRLKIKPKKRGNRKKGAANGCLKFGASWGGVSLAEKFQFFSFCFGSPAAGTVSSGEAAPPPARGRDEGIIYSLDNNDLAVIHLNKSIVHC